MIDFVYRQPFSIGFVYCQLLNMIHKQLCAYRISTNYLLARISDFSIHKNLFRTFRG